MSVAPAQAGARPLPCQDAVRRVTPDALVQGGVRPGRVIRSYLRSATD